MKKSCRLRHYLAIVASTLAATPLFSCSSKLPTQAEENGSAMDARAMAGSTQDARTGGQPAGAAGISAASGASAAAVERPTAGSQAAQSGYGAASSGGGGSGGMTGGSTGTVAAGHSVAGVHSVMAPLPGIMSKDKSAVTDTWWSYDRPAMYEVVSSNVKVPMRDGTPIACALSQPAKDGSIIPGKHPGLVVEFTPYALQSDQYATEAAYFVKRGYHTLVCLIRGIGGSGGTWQHPFAHQDAQDAHDLVEWLATQSFCDGRVGALGESYGGATTYGAAVERPPHLRAIAPMQSPGTLYDDVNYPGGIEATAGGPMNFWPTIAELMSLGAISADTEYALYHAHPAYDAFWKERTFRGQYDRIQVPVLALGGWIDNFFRSGMLSNIEPTLERTWVIYGQWVHTIPVDLGTCDSQCAADPLPGGVLLAWFDHWVMDLENTPIPEKATFLSFEGPKEAGRGWRELTNWVPEGSDFSHYELGSDGTLAQTVSHTASMTFHEPGEASAAGAALTFTTAPLDVDRVLLGRATLALHATLSGPDANFYAQLLDVDDKNAETLVNDGFLKASHRASHTEPSQIPTGQAVDYHIELRPQHYRFKAGNHVRIRLWGGPTDTLVQPSSVDVTVETGPRSSLIMPGFAAMH